MRTHLSIFTQKAKRQPAETRLVETGSGWLWNYFGVARHGSFTDLSKPGLHRTRECPLLVKSGCLTYPPSPRTAAGLGKQELVMVRMDRALLWTFRFGLANRVSRMGAHGMRMEPLPHVGGGVRVVAVAWGG